MLSYRIEQKMIEKTAREIFNMLKSILQFKKYVYNLLRAIY